MYDIITRHNEWSKDNEYFRIIRDSDHKTERIIVTLECFRCGCRVEADAHRFKIDDEDCKQTYYCDCPCCHNSMCNTDVRVERI